MRAAVLHAAKDLRIEPVATAPLGPGEVEVRIEAGGICGSDLHYYYDGGFGTVRLREPMILGHEIAGTIARLGAEVANVKVGERVAVNPSRPCNACRYCAQGKQQHCLNMLFYGSAMRFPHVQGGFRDVLVCDATQAVPVPAAMSAAQAAFAEPFAVCLHAVNRAGPLLGKRVLVTGAGPIGALTVVAARRAGALEIVATDVADAPLKVARQVGADATVDVSEKDALARYEAEKGYFDVMFEASGNAKALAGGLAVVRPQGIVVQIGIAGAEMSLPMNVAVAKEIELRGTFRFHAEFALAVALIGNGLTDVMPLLSATIPLEQANEAFALAADRSKAMKVQLAFG
ncbi:MAG TPA: L-idonate 5-dehydrogenase [Xanthobacteraceae bacterium]|nr:L-idonate 5-dehydrogenase [Xanthobacteraceae bacterium]